MKKSTIVIIGQAILIIALGVFSYTKNVIASAAQREAELQRKMAEEHRQIALAAQKEAEKQAMLAAKNAEKAMQESLRAEELHKQLSKRK